MSMQNIVSTLRIQSNLGNWGTIFLSYNFLEIFPLQFPRARKNTTLPVFPGGAR